MKLSPFSGEQIVQVTNPDPFARPILRSPVLHTPVWIIGCAQLVRLTGRLIRFAVRHPVADLIIAGLTLAWRYLGWPAPAAIAGALLPGSLTWRLAWPTSWNRHVAGPMRARWRRWHYKRSWAAVMTISGLAVYYRGRLLLPLLDPPAPARPRRPQPMVHRTRRSQAPSRSTSLARDDDREGGVITRNPEGRVEPLLTVAQVAELLGTPSRKKTIRCLT